MNINELYNIARDGTEADRNRLFESLAERFRLFVRQKIWDDSDGEEVVQDIMTTVLAKYQQIEFETSFSAWAYRIMENKVLGYYRRKKYHRARFTTMPDEMEPSGAISINPSLKRMLLDCLKKIGSVNNRYARVLNFRYQGYGTAEVCDRLGVTRNNLYILLSRARAQLKACLENGVVD